MRVMSQHWMENASPEELQAASHVVDHNAPEITCPACNTTFATGPVECPDCGLGLG